MDRKIHRLFLLFLSLSFLAFGPLGTSLLYKHHQSLVPRTQKALEKMGLPSRETDIQKLLETLQTKKTHLKEEKKFGPYFPIATWLLEQLDRVTEGIEPSHLPQLNSLEYCLGLEGTPQLRVEWIADNEESMRLIKHRLQETKGLRVSTWEKQKQTYSVLLEKL